MKTFIIAEAGVNHNGSLELALALVDAAAAAGADAVKFQTFKAGRVISTHAPKCDYQNKSTNQSQLEMVKALELPHDHHFPLLERCRHHGIAFMSTAFDEPSLHFLAKDLAVDMLKVPSGEVTNGPLLLATARYGRPIILSTGMSTLGEVETALGVLAFGYLGHADSDAGADAFRDAFASPQGQAVLREKLILLHCTSEYPATFDQVNLKAMQTLGAAFGLPVGLSDHTEGIAIPIAAAALGAQVVEKHFTLDRTLPGPDHIASIEPADLAAMVAGIRATEAALGQSVKAPTPAEWKNRPIIRRSLVASRPIAEGEVFTADNVDMKRPGTGISPMFYWSLIGRCAKASYEADEPISPQSEF